ncbi:MAG TPA: hypothetical protein VFN11_05190 [Ktedonobacterales bacterium]|nr:hypothetical protein [Ktedonobacterales bacterium]
MQEVRSDTPAHRVAPSYSGVRRTTPQAQREASARAVSGVAPQSRAGWSFQSPSVTAASSTAPSASGWRAPGTARPTPAPLSSLAVSPFAAPGLNARPDPRVWLIATVTAVGGMRSLEGAGRSGAIAVERPFGYLRAIRPVMPPGAIGNSVVSSGESAPLAASASVASLVRRGRTTGKGLGSAEARPSGNLPAPRPLPQIISAVEIETDAGIFRVERPNDVMTHSDIAWSLAHLEAGEPDSLVPLPRRQLALLLTLLPTPEDPEHPELDPTWGWAHRLRGPWERGPLHPRGRLGRLIAIDPDPGGKGLHRACFELLGSEDVVWALGVPCFRTGSVYELVPLGKGSRWLSWPVSRTRRRAGSPERPAWEIARVVYRVGSPRWPLAGVVEPLGPMGVAG